MKNGANVLIVAAAALSLLTGCSGIGSSVREVKIITTEMKFDPNTVQAKPGETIKFVIDNKGTVFHEFVSDDLKFKEVEVEPGAAKSVSVTLPLEPGEYKFYCEAKGHHEQGMEGKIVIAK